MPCHRLSIRSTIQFKISTTSTKRWKECWLSKWVQFGSRIWIDFCSFEKTRKKLQLQTHSLICVSVAWCGWFVFDCRASLADLPLLSGNYEIDDYVSAHQYQQTPWIVSSRFSNTDSIEHNFLSLINDDAASSVATSNDLESINHVNSQFGNAFIPSTVDKALNSLVNSDTILTQSNSIGQMVKHDVEKSTDHIHIVDVFSGRKPFDDFKKQLITPGNVQ